jgi:hypothetical protein
MIKKLFFGGFEWIFAKILSFVLVVIGFVVFTIAKGGFVVLSLWDLLRFLVIFWLLEELLFFVFSQIFHFFIHIYQPARNKPNLDTPLNNTLDQSKQGEKIDGEIVNTQAKTLE